MDRPLRPVNAPAHRPTAARGAVLALAALLALPACSFFEAPVIQRGNRVTEDQLREITPGVQTRQDVQALLGSPTQTSTFGDGTWFYISSKTRQRPGRALAVTDQETVVINFDQRGVVREIRRVGEDEAQPVDMVTRETPTPGNDRTLMQALFGNVGRIGPMGSPIGGTQPGAQAPSASGR
ncbi:outer membrane protein assembly factor BamE [Paracraurococcus lichenis]|uniref:Outer membrane protein assembly factor BamE n=1 Tax=Paracraurococcus lichenis TaxID=3064888 RepID=A0ABT9DUZ7_9PROT|nr:outer membrane protein assembly factor BamE [Paracraurococcus sp. LOR1-02]MDO9707722.1 outer membrane protein assembly factor BamE [Paracraurococcus sp. LOR1-02]